MNEWVSRTLPPLCSCTVWQPRRVWTHSAPPSREPAVGSLAYWWSVSFTWMAPSQWLGTAGVLALGWAIPASQEAPVIDSLCLGTPCWSSWDFLTMALVRSPPDSVLLPSHPPFLCVGPHHGLRALPAYSPPHIIHLHFSNTSLAHLIPSWCLLLGRL